MHEIEIVTTFLRKMAEHDVDATVAFLSEDVFVHNMPVAPTYSREEWKQRMLTYDNTAGGMKVQVLNIAGDGRGNVLTERADSFLRNGRWIEIPIMGAFTVKNGLIVSWREYFDMGATKGLSEVEPHGS
ncbi:limonene-1,2-epoxide hydrolase family protein [Streptomyces sp. NPDC102279]|uniref:limonene-1,2-epoxide hydrolase family protein n=1 Tax=Streptomyces sp. NPDC102279 TaxID=3366153 RepID=UPI00381A54A5